MSGWISSGCIAGVHHNRIAATVDYDEGTADVTGAVNTMEGGIVADFRYARLSFPFEGQRRQIDVDVQDGSAFSIDEVVELRSLRLDVPLWSFADFSDEPSGRHYPGLMKRRKSLEVWLSGSIGTTPIHPATATLGVVYYRYGSVAVRLFGGMSMTPYSGINRSIEDGAQIDRRHSGSAPGMVGGIEITLAAGEYALELIQFVLDIDTRSREATDRWQP